MIGPHEGRELELMLAGKKPLAMFHDLLLADHEIPEEIIPEEKFKPYVDTGKIIRYVEDVPTGKANDIIRYVLFSLPDETWRIQAYLWMTKEIFSGRRPADEASEIFTGRLLGYSEEDISDFLHKKAKRKS